MLLTVLNSDFGSRLMLELSIRQCEDRQRSVRSGRFSLTGL